MVGEHLFFNIFGAGPPSAEARYVVRLFVLPCVPNGRDLLVPQRHHRVYFDRPARGCPTRKHSDDTNRHHDCDEDDWVGLAPAFRISMSPISCQLAVPSISHEKCHRRNHCLASGRQPGTYHVLRFLLRVLMG